MNDLVVNGDSRSSKEQIRLLTNALQYNIELFSGGEEIWPDQCAYALSHLEMIKMIVQGYCRLFDNDACFPAARIPEQVDSGFVVALHYACKQLNELQMLVAAFQPVCRSLSKRIKEKRTKILNKLELFMLNGEDIIVSIASLEERGGQRRSVHYFPEVNSVVSSLPGDEPHHHQQRIAAGESLATPDTKSLPSYLVPVKDDYMEERDAPKRDLAEEGRVALLDDERAREKRRANNILPFAKGSMECRYSTPTKR